MPPLWKPQNGFHSGLEISHSTRDSHISTADPRLVRKNKNEGGLDSDDRFRHAQRAVRRGNSGGKGFEKPGSIPSENRQMVRVSLTETRHLRITNMIEHIRSSIGVPAIDRDVTKPEFRTLADFSAVDIQAIQEWLDVIDLTPFHRQPLPKRRHKWQRRWQPKTGTLTKRKSFTYRRPSAGTSHHQG